MTSHRNVVVWGNCQAEPLAALLTEPLARAGLTVVPVPPVFLATVRELDQVRNSVGEAAFLLSQPIRDEYRVPGCGTNQLASFLPPGGKLIRVSSAFDASAFPFQALAHDGAGERVAAPVTDYHDLRLIVAAARGGSSDEVLEHWPEQPSMEQFHAHADYCWDSLTGREANCDVRCAAVIRDDAAMFTSNHPSNKILAHLACRALAAMGFDDTVTPPAREFLGATRTSVEPLPAQELGWTPTTWKVAGREVGWPEIVESHLSYYREHPDIVADSLTRFAARLDLLGLAE